MMQPGEANFGNRACTTADHQTGIAGQSHDQISRIAHAAWDKHRAWPILQANIIGRNNTQHDAAGRERMFCRDPGGRTAATADKGNTETREKLASCSRQLIGARARLGATQNADLSVS